MRPGSRPERRSERPEPETVDCLGVHVANLGWDDFFRWFLERLERPGGRGACSNLFLVNAHTLNLAHVRPIFREVLNSAALVLNDGAGLEFYALLHGRRFPYNFNGTDLVPRLLGECSSLGIPLKLFLYGARPGRAAAAARRVLAEYPSMEVVGAIDGYEKDDAAVLEAIGAARPDLLLVALGNPLQEEWLAQNASNLDVRVAVGVGGLFDFLSGSVPRAPRVLRALRLEWLFRLWLEPGRMFHRYLVGNPLFLWRALAHRLGERR